MLKFLNSLVSSVIKSEYSNIEKFESMVNDIINEGVKKQIL